MPRNLERRVEIMFPIDKPELQKKLMTILNMQLKDTVKAHVLTDKGIYEKIDKRGKGSFNSQLEFGNMAVKAAKMQEQVGNSRVFIPEMHHE